jgi:competence protein ComEC
VIPLLPYFLAYCSGVLASIPEGREYVLPWFLPVTVASCGLYILFRRKNRQRIWKWGILLLLIPVGFFLPHWHKPDLPSNHISYHLDESQKASIDGVIIESPKLFAEKVQYTIKLETILYPLSNFPKPVSGNARVSLYQPENNLLAGDRVHIDKVRLKRPRNFYNPGSFNYEKFLRSQDIDVTGNISKQKSISKTGETTLPMAIHLPISLKQNMMESIDRNLPGDAGGLLKAMLLGEKNFLSSELRETYIASGLAHLMAVSGLHIGFVTGAAFFLLYPVVFSLLYKYWPEKTLAGWPKKIAAGLCFIPLIFYMVIVGPKISTLRAGIMVAVFLFAILLNRERSIGNAFLLAAFLILLAQPLEIIEPGFQLSFMAVFAILYAFNIKSKLQGDVIDQMGEVPWYKSMWDFDRPRDSVPIWFLYIFVGSAFISLAANLGTLPILIHHFHRVSLIGFILNIFMVPLASIMIPFALFLLTLGFVWQFLADAFFPLVGLLMQFFLFIPQYEASFANASIFIPDPPMGWSLLYYFVLFGIPWQLNRKRSLLAINPRMQNLQWRHPLPWALIIATILMTVWIIWPRWPLAKTDELKITMLDIGQGESIFIEFPNHKTMLIDGGGFYKNSLDVGRMVLAPFILSKSLGQIDYMVATHSDNDHISGLESILDILKTENIIVRNNTLEDRRIKNLHEKAIDLGAKPIYLEANAPFNIGDVRLTLLHPDRNYLLQRKKNKRRISNDLSLVIRMAYGDFSILLTGDINQQAEDYLTQQPAKLKTAILKAPHHGSRFSSTPEFVNSVSPEEVLFSVGYLNYFHHPHSSVLDRYSSIGADIWRTDLHGALSITSNGQGYEITNHRSLENAN